jgi:hypothetical protein
MYVEGNFGVKKKWLESPIWGMWANALVESLGWQSKESGAVGKHECRMNPGHYAPTWSWASVDGPVSHVSAKPTEGFQKFHNDPLIYDLEVRRFDFASGLITVTGHAISVELNCRVERNEHWELYPAEALKFDYHYEILKVYPAGSRFHSRSTLL